MVLSFRGFLKLNLYGCPQYLPEAEYTSAALDVEFYKETSFMFTQMVDPGGLSNWTLTHVDWSEGGWHPKSYGKEDITVETLRHLQASLYFGCIFLFLPRLCLFSLLPLALCNRE